MKRSTGDIMCGFVGFIDHNTEKEKIIEKMMDRIVHRGPDMGGRFCDENAALGFRRLSIIDLSTAGLQPLYSNDGKKVLVFNGEIYNFKEIRAELEKKGYEFQSNTDSEVLIHGYCEYGRALLDRLRGMFAFCIWDREKKTLFAARDPFGIKPLYYYEYQKDGENCLMFASEIKSFLDHPDFVKAVNEKALKPYLTFQYSAQPEETFFKGVKRLRAGHFLTFADGRLTTEEYWDVHFEDEKRPLEENVQRIRDVIDDSVLVHKHAEVPYASFLSGGIDSSYITACLMPDKTFSVGFGQESFDETTQASELSEILGIENVKRIITGDDCFGKLSEIQYHMDEPESNPSALPLYFLAKLVRDSGVTVVLSGEGADEIFGGYIWYDEDSIQRTLKHIPKFLRGIIARIARVLPDFKGRTRLMKAGLPVEETFVGEALVFEERQANRVLRKKYKNAKGAFEIAQEVYRKVQDKDDLTKKQYLDLKLFLEGDILQKADKMSMAHSIELRVPFLDREVMRVGEGIGSDQKIAHGTTKYVLRKASEFRIPAEWFKRRKKGFPVPVRLWFREKKYYDFVKKYFNADYAGEFFNIGEINRMLDLHFEGKRNYGRQIYTVLVFLVWYERFFILEKSAAQTAG